jgi:hypothetical protein
MIIEKAKYNEGYILSEIVGEGSNSYLFTMTYINYTLRQAKRLFKIAIEEEATV